jgi:hypothetical protein
MENVCHGEVNFFVLRGAAGGKGGQSLETELDNAQSTTIALRDDDGIALGGIFREMRKHI